MSVSRRVPLTCLFWFACLSFAPLAHALDSVQSALLREAQSHLQALETNLKLAQQSAGAGAVSGAKAKLALSRLQGAVDAVGQVQARLERLPAGDPAVASVAQRFAAASASIEQLRARLRPGGAPETPTTAASPAADPSSGKSRSTSAPSAPPLDYRQREELKAARFHLEAVSGWAGALEDLAGKSAANTDIAQLDLRQLQNGMTTIATARQRADQARARLDALPEAGEGVAEVVADLRSAVDRINAAEKILEPLHARLSQAIGLGNSSVIAADTQRLRDLAAMFYDQTLFQRNLSLALDRARELTAARTEHAAIMNRHAALLAQQTPASAALRLAETYFLEQFQAFSRNVDAVRTSLPAALDADFRRIDAMVQEATTQRKPAFFTQGIPDEMRRIDGGIAFLEGVDAAPGAAVRKRFRERSARLAQEQAALREAIVAANELPQDNFHGSDRNDVLRAATEAWRKREPGAKVVAVRIPADAWSRDVRWRKQTSDWHKIDRSYLQAQVIVQHSPTLAVIRPIDLWKDHLEGDRLTASPHDALTSELLAHDFVLLAKVR